MASPRVHPTAPFPRPRLSCLLVALLALQPACGAGWRRMEPTSRPVLHPRQQVEVWSQGNPHRWHGVEWSADSISGVPFLRPELCDSCRLALSEAAVDSIRLGNPVGGFWRGFWIAAGASTLAMLVLQGAWQ